MAKKKGADEQPSEEEKVSLVNDILLKSIEKKFGENILISASSLIENPPELISWSPSFDAITGGVPRGCLISMSGQSGTGKTTSALGLAKKFLDQTPDGEVYFINEEMRLKPRDLHGIHGLDVSKVHIIQSTEEKIMEADETLDTCLDILKSRSNIFMIIDSVSALMDGKTYEGGVATETRGASAKTTYRFCTQAGKIAAVRKSIVVGLMQLYKNTSGWGVADLEKGGNGFVYHSQIRLQAKGVEYVPDKDDPVAQKTTWQALKTATNTPPLRKCASYIRYGVGIDEASELLEWAEKFGEVQVKGAWVYYGEEKFQGREKAREYFSQRENFDKLYPAIRKSFN